MPKMQSLLLTLCAVSGALAHNWVHSRSRAPVASTVQPCLPKIDDVPHVQVGPNQNFQVEWMTGHGGSSFFAVMHEKDAHRLEETTREVMRDYVDNAPDSASMPDKVYRKYFRKRPANDGSCSLDNGDTSAFFKRSVVEADNDFIKPNFGPATCQMEFHEKDMTNDRRVSYKSEKYPWIEAVHIYEIRTKAASLMSTANFRIPGRAGAGRYIVQYIWGGYADCIDVDYVVDRQIENIYGVPVEGGDSYQRIDHCYFEDQVTKYITGHCTEAPGGYIAASLGACGKKGSFHCKGVQVCPLFLPDSVPERLRDTELIPWGASRNKHTGTTDQWICDKSKYEGVTDKKTMVGWGVNPRKRSQTFDVYRTTNDPSDPYYYCTCYYIKPQLQFEGLPPPAKVRPINWRQNEHCLPCNLTQNNQFVDTMPAFWDVNDDTEPCVNCDLENSAQDNPPPPALNLYGMNPPFNNTWTLIDKRPCDGIASLTGNGALTYGYENEENRHSCGAGDASVCVKKLTPIAGISNTIPQMCQLLAERDPECSDHVMLGTWHVKPCFCWLKKACCGKCSVRNSVRYLHTYQLPAK